MDLYTFTLERLTTCYFFIAAIWTPGNKQSSITKVDSPVGATKFESSSLLSPLTSYSSVPGYSPVTFNPPDKNSISSQNFARPASATSQFSNYGVNENIILVSRLKHNFFVGSEIEL